MAHIIINPSLSAAIAYNLFFNPQKFAEVGAILGAVSQDILSHGYFNLGIVYPIRGDSFS